MSPVHTHLSHRHDPLCSHTLDLPFFPLPIYKLWLVYFSSYFNVSFPSCCIHFVFPQQVSYNYTLALFIQETVDARTQFFRRSHIASFPPHHRLCLPQPAGCITLVLYGAAYRLGCCRQFVVSFVTLLFRNQERQEEKVGARAFFLKITCPF